MTAIDAWIMQRTNPPTSNAERGDHASADASSPPGVRRWPTIAQQRADGLIALDDGRAVVAESLLGDDRRGVGLDEVFLVLFVGEERDVGSSRLKERASALNGCISVTHDGSADHFGKLTGAQER